MVFFGGGISAGVGGIFAGVGGVFFGVDGTMWNIFWNLQVNNGTFFFADISGVFFCGGIFAGVGGSDSEFSWIY